MKNNSNRNPDQSSFFCFINKAKGLTSQQCLSKFKRQYGYKKIGHHGTLDPFATGLLLVGVNEATKFFRFIDDSVKTYEATVKLGVRTDTLDRDGSVQEELEVPSLDIQKIQKMADGLTGELEQTPPMYSAVKIGGKKLYELARQGKEVERKSRMVHIHDFKILEWESPIIQLITTVSRGTYIRVLVEQLAEALGTIGHTVELSRTNLCGQDLSVGFSLDEADIPADARRPIESLLTQYRQIQLNEDQVRDLFYGKKLSFEGAAGEIVMAFQGQTLLGMLEKQGDIWKSLRLINSQKL